MEHVFLLILRSIRIVFLGGLEFRTYILAGFVKYSLELGSIKGEDKNSITSGETHHYRCVYELNLIPPLKEREPSQPTIKQKLTMIKPSFS